MPIEYCKNKTFKGKVKQYLSWKVQVCNTILSLSVKNKVLANWSSERNSLFKPNLSWSSNLSGQKKLSWYFKSAIRVLWIVVRSILHLDICLKLIVRNYVKAISQTLLSLILCNLNDTFYTNCADVKWNGRQATFPKIFQALTKTKGSTWLQKPIYNFT